MCDWRRIDGEYKGESKGINWTEKLMHDVKGHYKCKTTWVLCK